MSLPKTYAPGDYESDIYKLWEQGGVFKPKNRGGDGTFSIILPPPNATGKLHVGHAAMLAIEDTMIRYQRMLGKEVLWTPGTDHAAIATENYVIEAVRRERKIDDPRAELGREEVIRLIKEFVAQSQDTIRSQVRAMGSSVDWDRERYTMEDAMTNVVEKVFLQMYEDGLVYRGGRVINWDPNLQTTVSDDEVEYKEEVTKFYTFQYGPFQIGTARPETKFGDKYVVMHPDDKRYAKYKHGDTFECEWINGQITATVIKDESVDPEFGTGVMTITPWHDATDYFIAENHNLDKEQIIDFDGKLLDIAGEFAGMPIEEAREKIVEKLDKKGLLVEVDENYTHNVAISYRGGGVIEPQIKPQWFIDVTHPVVEWKNQKMSLKEVMKDVVASGDIKILPARFEKVYYSWIDNLHNWNISRQIWWGHRIPAWFRDGNESNVYVGSEPPKDKGWEQDPDTLDTWFSSGLWTWSTMIPEEVGLKKELSLKQMLDQSPDFEKFHPTSVMETGYDILFFWVARMILMTTYVTGEVPFKTVYLHGLVRTKDGSKMSKSKPESIIDPLEMVEKYGTDALRLSLLVGQSPGADMRIFDSKVEGFRNFCNKLWNIARYVESKVGENYEVVDTPKPETIADYWILDRLAKTLNEVGKDLDTHQLGRAYESLYHFIWDDFADWYVEASKIHLNKNVLVYILESVLRATHPFAPFVTEAIWQKFNDSAGGSLAVSRWPAVAKVSQKEVEEFERVRQIIVEVRRLRTELKLKQSTLHHADSALIATHQNLIQQLAGLSDILTATKGEGLTLTQTDETAWLDVEQSVVKEYITQLEKQRSSVDQTISSLQKRLANKAYVANAPKNLVEDTKQQLHEQEALKSRLSDEISSIQAATKS